MAEQPAKPVLDINYIKSSVYREAACDGAIGGATPRNKLWIGFFTERLPVPRIVRHAVLPTTVKGEFTFDPGTNPTPVETRSGLVRNLEFGLYLTVDAARELHSWLGKQIEEIDDTGESNE